MCPNIHIYSSLNPKSNIQTPTPYFLISHFFPSYLLLINAIRRQTISIPGKWTCLDYPKRTANECSNSSKKNRQITCVNLSFLPILQAKQFLNLYSFLVGRCFDDCINDFTSDTLSSKEKECTKKCTGKLLKVTNRIGQQMAEKQMTAPSGANQ